MICMFEVYALYENYDVYQRKFIAFFYDAMFLTFYGFFELYMLFCHGFIALLLLIFRKKF